MTAVQNGSQEDTSVVYDKGVNYIDSLLRGVKWGSVTGTGVSLTYSFPWLNGVASYWASNPNYSDLSEPSSGYGLSSTQQAAVRTALTAWSSVANVTLIEVSESQANVGDIRFAWTNKTDTISTGGNAWGWSRSPNSYWASGGDIWLSSPVIGSQPNSYWQSGGYGLEALMHEIGHSLGLKHPFEDSPVMPAMTILYSIMSYTEDPSSLFVTYTQNGNNYSWSTDYINPDTPMLYDIAAMQYLYGANKSYHSGNDVYTFDPTKPFIRTIWDGGGSDTISVSNFSLACVIDLQDGHYSKIAIHSAPPSGVNWKTPPPVSTYDTAFNLAIAFGVTIENAIGGSGGDTLIGNIANNVFTGGAGNDFIDGGAGVNTSLYAGKSSNFKLSVGASQHTVNDRTGAEGLDTIQNIQNVQFTDTTLQTKWFTEARSLALSKPSDFKVLTEMYIAYFNRAPDAVGLDYWASSIFEGQNTSQVARSFFGSPEAIATFGSVSSASSTAELTKFVNGVYTNVLNRNSDASGLNYWVNLLKSGTVAPGDFILAIISSVNNQSGTADRIYIDNKQAVGAHFAVTNGLTDTTQAKAVMATFNSTYSSSGASAAVTAANNLSDGYLSHVSSTPELIIQLIGVNV